MSIGKVPCSSSFCATGMMRSRVNLRAVSTSCLCSSVMLKSIRLFSHEAGLAFLQEGLHAFRPILGVVAARAGLRLLPLDGSHRQAVTALYQAFVARDGHGAPIRH